jgi:TonB-linked SusC/RagA family outer membrane protein
MKKHQLLLVVLSLLFCYGAYAQNRTLIGSVTSNQDPVPGAAILIKGQTTGTSTDESGKFSLSVPAGSVTLVITSIGFESQERVVSATENNITIRLASSVTSLNEVVVTALGISREAKTLTYATQQVRAEQLTTVKSTNVLNSLDGKIAGVQINRTSGGPGGSVRVVLRGDKSTRNSQPLYVIDGLPITNPIGGPDAGLYNTVPDQGDIMSSINPEDIESINVLKGASASALYGSQGSNGVILITTKKGRTGAAKIDFSSGVTFDKASILPDLQYRYNQSTPATATTEGSEDSWGEKAATPGSDYLKSFYETGTTWINSINMSVGNEKSTSFVSYSNTVNKGILPTSTLDQNTLSFRQNNKFLNDKLIFDGTFLGSIQKSHNRLTPGIYFNPLTGLMMLPRGFDLSSFEDFEYFSPSRYLYAQNWWNINTDKGFGGQDYQQNPYWVLNRNAADNKNQNIYAAVSLKYLLNNWLSISTRGNINNYINEYRRDIYATTQGTLASINGNLNSNKSNATNLYGDLLLIGNKDLSSDFNLNFTLGGVFQDQKSFGTNIGGSLITPNVFLESAVDWTDVSKANLTNSASRRRILSLLGSVELGFQNKVFINFSDRNDWSSTLAFTPSKNKGYNYYSVGANAILTEIFTIPEAINFMKIRASYAIVGNDVNPFATQPLYTFNAGRVNPPGSKPLQLSGFYLQPERNKALEIGTEWRMFDDKLSFDFNWYKSNVLHQYFAGVSVATSLGAGSTADINGGDIQNTGVEFSVNYRVIQQSDFKWSTSLNLSHNKSLIKELYSKEVLPDPNTDIRVNLGGGIGSLKQGGQFGDFYGKAFKRDDSGRIIVGADGVPLSEDNVFLGNPNPKLFAGWNNTFDYKNLSFSFLIDGKFGGKVISITDGYLDQMGVSERTAAARDNGGVAVPNAVDESGNAYTALTDAKLYYKGIGGKTPVGEAYLFDATNVRFREASLMYRLPLKSNAVKDIRIGLIANNLFFFSLKAPFDPDQVAGVNPGGVGQNVFGYPATRSFGLNFKCSF